HALVVARIVVTLAEVVVVPGHHVHVRVAGVVVPPVPARARVNRPVHQHQRGGHVVLGHTGFLRDVPDPPPGLAVRGGGELTRGDVVLWLVVVRPPDLVVGRRGREPRTVHVVQCPGVDDVGVRL